MIKRVIIRLVGINMCADIYLPTRRGMDTLVLTPKPAYTHIYLCLYIYVYISIKFNKFSKET